jgi:hypothetical protein
VARLRRHPILVGLGAVALLIGVGLLATGWYLVGEAERTGRLVSAAFSRTAGVPVSVERARLEGPFRLVLYNLHLPPGPRWTGDVRVRELRLEGGLLPILFPRGRALEIVLVSTSVKLAEHAAPLEPPSAESLETLRRLVMRVIEWPAVLSLRIEGGELREGDQVVTFDLTGERTQTGAIGLALKVSPPGGPPALSLRLAGAATQGQVSLRIDARGEPARLGAFWPAALPALAQVAVQAEGRLKPGGQVELAGVARAERAGGPPLAIEFASLYRAAAARLELSRLGLDWGEGLRLRGSGAVELEPGGTRVALDLAGPAAGSPVTLALSYAGATGAVTARLQAEGIDARRLFSTAGLASPPADVTAGRLRAELSGSVQSGQERVAIDASFEDVGARELGADLRVDGQLRGDATFGRGASGLELGRLGPTTLTLTRGGGVVLALTASSRGEAPWPLAVEAVMGDLGRLPTPPSLPATLTGHAQVSGELDRGRFVGVLAAQLPRVELRFTSPIVVTGVRAKIPLAWGAPTPATAGTLAADRLAAYGLVLDRLRSSARFADGRLVLPDIQYVHYGGHGGGSVEAAVGASPVPLRTRIEGEHVDLAAVTQAYGLTVAHLTGRVHYLFVLEHSAAHGLIAIGQANSEEGGGEVGIEAIEKLLSSAKVQGESTGVLRKTLETLRVFRYASLDAEVRVVPGGGHVSFSLEGQKRLGIFPPPVKAINFSNVPLALLLRTFARKEVQ